MKDFVALIEQHKHEHFRFILRTVWDTSAAEDVYASAVLAAWENREKFQPGTNFRAWMYRIITNKLFVANREVMRAPRALEETPEAAFATLDEDPDYALVLDNPQAFMEQCGEEVFHAFKKLSTGESSCLLLRSAHRFSYKEIAEIMGMPVGTVMTHLARGRAKLRRELMDYARDRGLIRGRLRLLQKEEARDQPKEKCSAIVPKGIRKDEAGK